MCHFFINIFMISQGFYLYELFILDLSKQSGKLTWVHCRILFKNELTYKPRDSSDRVLKVSLKDELASVLSHGPSSRLQMVK